jgi:hypothetical protein
LSTGFPWIQGLTSRGTKTGFHPEDPKEAFLYKNSRKAFVYKNTRKAFLYKNSINAFLSKNLRKAFRCKNPRRLSFIRIPKRLSLMSIQGRLSGSRPEFGNTKNIKLQLKSVTFLDKKCFDLRERLSKLQKKPPAHQREHQAFNE